MTQYRYLNKDFYRFSTPDLGLAQIHTRMCLFSTDAVFLCCSLSLSLYQVWSHPILQPHRMEEMRGKMMIFLPGLHFFPLHCISLFPRKELSAKKQALQPGWQKIEAVVGEILLCIGASVSKHRVRCQPWAACQNIVCFKKNWPAIVSLSVSIQLCRTQSAGKTTREVSIGAGPHLWLNLWDGERIERLVCTSYWMA